MIAFPLIGFNAFATLICSSFDLQSSKLPQAYRVFEPFNNRKWPVITFF